MFLVLTKPSSGSLQSVLW